MYANSKRDKRNTYEMKKYKIGYTTGVFDLFHIGHLNILKKAKNECDRLIVGVSTDELVEGYKKKRPVISYKNRLEIVEAIKYVDQVVPQTSMNKLLAWEKLNFDVIFHGNDWKGSQMYLENEKNLNKVGVDCVYFKYTEGISSTEISKKLNNE